MNTAPPPAKKKSDPTLGILLIFIIALALACVLIWTGWESLKRSADPYASLDSTSDAIIAESYRLNV